VNISSSVPKKTVHQVILTRIFNLTQTPDITMKTFVRFVLVSILTLVPSASALAPVWFLARGFAAQRSVAIINERLSGVTIGAGGAPAKSKEEDLELTRLVILRHIASLDEFAVFDDGEDIDEDDEVEVEEVVTNTMKIDDAVEEVDPFGKIKQIGRKIKSSFKTKVLAFA